MDIEVVEDEHDLLGVRVVNINEILDAVGLVVPTTALGDRDMTPTGKRLIPEEEICRPAPLMLVILTQRRAAVLVGSGARRQRWTSIGQELDGVLIETDLRKPGIVRPGADV